MLCPVMSCPVMSCHVMSCHVMSCHVMSCHVMSCYVMLCLTNRFHIAVRLFSNRSQMTSKCGKNKKVAHEAIAECVTDVLTTF